MKKRLYLLTALALLIMAVAGCRLGSAELEESVTIEVVATEDFGREVIFERQAVIDHRMSAQDVLAEVTDFETDGSYILEFEGLRGNDQVYWMYYINGFLSKWFAGIYIIRPGDVMVWDFHPWAGAHHGSSAIIGSFPEPMLHGFEGATYPTIVVYGDGFRDEAVAVADGLAGLGINLSLSAEDELTEADTGSHNIVLIADSGSELIADLNEKHEPLGMYVYFEGDKLNVTDYKFQAEQSCGAGTGVIQASQNPWNPMGTGACQNVVFMVSGLDEEGVDRAVQLVLDTIQDIKDGNTPVIAYTYGVIITADGEVVRTPL